MQNPYTHRKAGFEANYRLDRPPGRLLRTHKPNFVVELRFGCRGCRKADVESLIAKCKSKAESFAVFPKDKVAASLFFRQWAEALEAIVCLWEFRLNGIHDFTPELISNVLVPSDMDELRDRLRTVFRDHVKGLIEGKEVKKWVEKSDRVSQEITNVSRLLETHNKLGAFNELCEKKKVRDAEKELIEKRINEFRSAMNCILNFLDEKPTEEAVRVFKLDGDFNWKRMFKLIMRERHRLDDGLPIYAYRQDILLQILYQQVVVLIGETGSGKSTQLVQFLADSGVGANESIICTQPRKIAAISLADRVGDESSDCYEDGSVKCFSTYSSSHQFNSKIIYMTDYCLLQHYMSDKNMSGISCIIIDEAHERSLNTDLLLALLKSLLCQKLDLRLIIMSATANAIQLSDYFFKCGIFHVVGRNFPVDVRYVPYLAEGPSDSAVVPSYVSDMEVEWACAMFEAPSAVALALHGKLSSEEQFRVFQNHPGKRKVIFATNLAETSLTIPGVKYVIDSGMVKESKFDPSSGMNILKVCWISQSSADQRAGRAGRTEPGRCYRLYTESDYKSMVPNQEPEIRRVHLGVAVLRILALGIKNVQDFDFVDAPSPRSVEMAIRNLIQLGAVELNNNIYELTEEGRYLVKLGIEPRIGKLVISCYNACLGKEGVVLAAVMANASNIFCRVGSDGDKVKSDCLKVQFCHCNGDLFTLLSVYKEWEALPRERKNKWCWENSINAKSMRRCQDTILELENCLKYELNFIIPSYWAWNPHKYTEHDKSLKKVILSSLAENVAMYSGYDRLGYEVALTGQHVQLHPSSSLLIFGKKPNWVVFGELLSISSQYLVCVTAFDIESLFTLRPPPLFDVSKLESKKLQRRVLSGFGCTLLKRFCGKSNSNLLGLVSRVRAACNDDRIGIEVNVDQNEVRLYAMSGDMEKVLTFVNDILDYERKWLRNECMEKCLYHGSGSPTVALFGAGAEIKHLELEKRCLTVDVYHSNINMVDDKDLLAFIEKHALGSICAIHKFTAIGLDAEEKEKWGRITFLSPDAA
ncbi:ATP-dependent RNA helicase [Quillaja saponaria]|uniref:RNA helicase n=1 Tax=Quillaja saponaria TaxID=32244 RepID=A0AAD7PV73_QUISA|nr:ATP-dependent RNA helicase [Quillaja saponaria]